MKVFGPVPSRRLGRSIGINNIPPKICTYSCVYCQAGVTTSNTVNRDDFYQPEEVFKLTKEQLQKAQKHNEHVDYFCFAPDGEPTLDRNLGKTISLLKTLNIKIGVITNSSLLWRNDVREDLLDADWISLKVDAAQEKVWHDIDHAHRSLRLMYIFEGLRKFSKIYKGKLVSETMLINGLNDDESHLERLAIELQKINPSVAYLSVPTRPPAKSWVKPSTEDRLNTAFQIFSKYLPHVEYLTHHEDDNFGFTGNVEEDILNITSVHPMRRNAMNNLLNKAESDWEIVEKLISSNQLIETEYEGEQYYVRKF